MKYHTPQVEPVGVASELIQTKQQPLTDGGNQGHIVAVSNLLEN